MEQQRRLFECPRCNVTVLASAPPADDDDADEWPVCQGKIRVGDMIVDTHSKAEMAPAGGD